MSFLDNLESSLKNLENVTERETPDERRRRGEERSRALAIGPSAEALKKSPFVNDLITHAVRIGHGMRVKITPAWFGSSLRLEARERRLELRPTESGVVAAFSSEGQEGEIIPVDLESDPEPLARRWLSGMQAIRSAPDPDEQDRNL